MTVTSDQIKKVPVIGRIYHDQAGSRTIRKQLQTLPLTLALTLTLTCDRIKKVHIIGRIYHDQAGSRTIRKQLLDRVIQP
jgi:hypothetical protein